MNGSTVPLLVWTANALLSLVLVLIGVVVRMHAKSDEEHRERYEREMEKMRGRLHEVQSKMAGFEALAKSKGWF